MSFLGGPFIYAMTSHPKVSNPNGGIRTAGWLHRYTWLAPLNGGFAGRAAKDLCKVSWLHEHLVRNDSGDPTVHNPPNLDGKSIAFVDNLSNW